MPLGQRFLLAVAHPTDGAETLLGAEVVRHACGSTVDAEPGLGLRFVHKNEDSRRQMEGLVRGLLAADSIAGGRSLDGVA